MKLDDYAAELARGQEAFAAAKGEPAKLDAVQANAGILAAQLDRAIWAPDCRQRAASLAKDFWGLFQAANDVRYPVAPPDDMQRLTMYP